MFHAYEDNHKISPSGGSYLGVHVAQINTDLIIKMYFYHATIFITLYLFYNTQSNINTFYIYLKRKILFLERS